MESELGRGSYSTVWRAHDPTLDRDVAIKVPRIELDSVTANDFLREAKRVAKLNHEGIVGVLEASIDDSSSTPYIVLELVDGVTLREWCSFVDLTFVEHAKIVSSIAWAVHFAHTAGIIHRDLKPANVLVSLSGKVQVADFGLAMAIGIDVSTETSTTGTIAYMSPEQAKLLPNPVSVASDLYSIGVILFELLTGTNPIDATSPSEHLAKLAVGKRKKLTEVRPDVPRDLAIVCEKALEHEPSNRFSTARELAEDLERFVKGEAIHSRSHSKIELLFQMARRRKQLLAFVLAGLVATFACGTAGVYFQQRLTRERVTRQRLALSTLLTCQPEGVPNALDEIKPFAVRVQTAQLSRLNRSKQIWMQKRF